MASCDIPASFASTTAMVTRSLTRVVDADLLVIFFSVEEVIRVPRPRTVDTNPDPSNVRYARATVLRFTPRSAANCRTGGNSSLGCNSPIAIARRRPDTICSLIGIGESSWTVSVATPQLYHTMILLASAACPRLKLSDFAVILLARSVRWLNPRQLRSQASRLVRRCLQRRVLPRAGRPNLISRSSAMP